MPLVVDRACAIIQNSIQDPYGQADFSEIIIFRKFVLAKLSPIVELVLNPEHSDIDLRPTDELHRQPYSIVPDPYLRPSIDTLMTRKKLLWFLLPLINSKILRTSKLKGAAKACKQLKLVN